MSRKNKKNTNHHIIPKSRGGPSSLENITRVNDLEHQKFHALFENRTPEESIYYLVNTFWKKDWDYVENSLRKYKPRYEK